MWYELLPRILNMSLTAGIIILFVCICRLLLIKAPKIYSYALWSVVAFRLLCPVSLSAPVSLLGLFHTPVTEVVTHETQENTAEERISTGSASAVEYIPSQIVHEEYPEITLPVGGGSGVVAENINQALPQGEEQLGADPLEAPVSLFTYLWLSGILVMVGRGIFSYIKLHAQLTGAVLLEKNIYLADHIPGPFVMGLIKPGIYLPSDLQEKEHSYIILHEQHHIHRGDHLFKVLGYLALSIHWFNPLVWIAFRLFVKDMEMSCDEAVLGKLGEEIRADYSASLLQFAVGQKSVYGTPLAFGEGETKGRIRNLSAWKKPGRILSVVAILVCVAAILFCFFNPALVKEALHIDGPGVHIPELTQEKLEALYQQEFDKYDDKLPADVQFDFKSLTYKGKVYTSDYKNKLAYSPDEPVTNWETSLEEYPLEKICDVYGQPFIKPVYGDLNADGRYSDTYAWYDDASKVEGEYIQGTLWKFGEYDTENLVALTVPEVYEDGTTLYRLYIYYHLNGITLETGKDLLDKILNPMNAGNYIVVGQMETWRILDGQRPEDIYFLGDVYKGTVVTEKEVKDPEKYEVIHISEKKPYSRILAFRDYGDGIIGYATPEGTVIYIKTDWSKASESGEGIQESENQISGDDVNAQVEEKTTISGSFTVTVREVIPDYTLDDITPTVAVVTQFQGSPFTMYVGEEIGAQLAEGETYVFTIQAFEVAGTKEALQKKTLAAIVQEYASKFSIVDFRTAGEQEKGVDSLNLTIGDSVTAPEPSAEPDVEPGIEWSEKIPWTDLDGDGTEEYILLESGDFLKQNVVGGRITMYVNNEPVYQYAEELWITGVGDKAYLDLNGDGQEEIFVAFYPAVNSMPLAEWFVLERTENGWERLEMYHEEGNMSANAFPISVVLKKKDFDLAIRCEGWYGEIVFDGTEHYARMKEELEAGNDAYNVFAESQYEAGDVVGETLPWGVWEIQAGTYEGQNCLIALHGLCGPAGKYDYYGEVSVYFNYDDAGKIEILNVEFSPANE